MRFVNFRFQKDHPFLSTPCFLEYSNYFVVLDYHVVLLSGGLDQYDHDISAELNVWGKNYLKGTNMINNKYFSCESIALARTMIHVVVMHYLIISPSSIYMSMRL